GSASVAWWAMVSPLSIIGSAFAALFYSYFYIRLFSEQWPQEGLPRPELWLGGAAYLALMGAGGCQRWALNRFRIDDSAGARIRYAAAMVIAAAYLGMQVWDWSELNFTHQTNAYGSLYFVISGTLALMVLVGLALTGSVLLRLGRAAPHDQVLV